MATVSLSAGVRSALTSLSQTTAASQQGQYRLATGKKVNSAVDNRSTSSPPRASMTAPAR